MTSSNTKFARWSAPALTIVLTSIAFFPALDNGFVDLDDDSNFLNNPKYRGLGWTEHRWMFTTFYMGHYQPLSWVTLGLDYVIWGMNPLGYHLTNLILHALAAVIFYFICARLLALSLPPVSDLAALRIGATIAALLFAIHPLRVESVAWVTERRDVLSGLFFLLTVLWYLKAATADTNSSYGQRMVLALAFYTMSLLSKAVGMSLPLVLAILDVYPLKRLGGEKGGWLGRDARRVWLEKLPFVLLAGAAAWLAVLAQNYARAMVRLVDYGIVERAVQVFYNLVFYVWKTALPAGLSPLHEIPWPFDPWNWIYLASTLAVVALTCALLFFRHRWPAGLAVWAYYAATVMPVSGIAQSGSQLVADRYSYLSCLGWAVLVGGGLLFLWERRQVSRRTFAAASATVILVIAGLGSLTWRQTQVWHDSERLFRHVLARDPSSRIALNNLGNLLLHRGRVDEAVVHYRRALHANPHYPNSHANLALALTAQGKLDEAIGAYREAVRLNPAFTGAHINLGEALVARGELDEAIGHFSQAVQNDPGSALARYRWGNALLRKGDLDGAVEQYRRTIEIDPKNVEAHANLGSALGARGEDEAAINHYREAIKIDPYFIQAHFNLGVLYGERRETKEAIEHFRKVVQTNPSDAEAYSNLGKFLAMEGKAAEAADYFRAALRIQPGLSEAKEGLNRAMEGQRKK